MLTCVHHFGVVATAFLVLCELTASDEFMLHPRDLFNIIESPGLLNCLKLIHHGDFYVNSIFCDLFNW